MHLNLCLYGLFGWVGKKNGEKKGKWKRNHCLVGIMRGNSNNP